MTTGFNPITDGDVTMALRNLEHTGTYLINNQGRVEGRVRDAVAEVHRVIANGERTLSGERADAMSIRALAGIYSIHRAPSPDNSIPSHPSVTTLSIQTINNRM